MAKTIYPDQQKIVELFIRADNKDDKTRYPVELFRYLHKIRDINPRVGGHIRTRNVAVSSFGWRLVSPDNASDQKIIETTIRLQKTINFLAKRHALTHAYGHQVYNLKWDLINGKHTPSVTPANYENYECFEGRFFEFKEFANKQEIDLNPGILLDASSTENTQGGIMRSIFLIESLNLETIKERANFIKKLKGILQIINKGGDGEEQAAAEQAAHTAIKDNFLITSEMIEFKLNQIASGNAPFKEIVDEFNASIAIAFLGQSNTTQLPNSGGSYAALKILNLISSDIHYSDIVHFQDFINNQLLKYDYQLNYEKDGIPPYAFEIKIEEEIDREANAAAVTAMLATGLPFVETEIYNLLGMTIPEATDKLVQTAPPAF